MENLFEELFGAFINFCLEYNRLHIIFVEDEGFVHIRGGASLKYHMKKRGFQHQGITNDIDVLLFGEDFEEFFNRLSKIIPNLKWTFSNGLYRIYYKDVPFVDLIVLEHYTDTDDEKSMFRYAYTQMGFDTIEDYIHSISETDDIERLTFTSPEFEYYNVSKGVEIYSQYIDDIPRWKMIAKTSKENDPMGQRMRYQTTTEYINKLKSKLDKYKLRQRIWKTFMKD